MEHRFNVKNALKVFGLISERGEQVPEGYLHEGITAKAEFDGYTVSMSDVRVTLYIYFHNKHKFEFERNEDLERFINHLERLGQ